jgi:type IV pilus assembly protein PilY1
MRTRHLDLFALALLGAAVLPLAGDAALPEPVPTASKAACCNVADAPPPPLPKGDENFFNIPSGVPNVMILLDNSGSMESELPRTISTTYPIDYTGVTATGGCALPDTSPLGKLSSTWTASTTTIPPYDSGYKTYFDAAKTLVALDDTPKWTSDCTAVAAPTTDNTVDTCLFRGGASPSYYKYYGESPVGLGITSATVFNHTPNLNSSGVPTTVSGPCAAISDNNGTMSTNAAALTDLKALYSSCTFCLSSKGYFLFAPGGKRQAVIRGDLMNVFPDNPLLLKAITARKIVKNLVKYDPLNPNTGVDVIRFGLAATNGGSNSASSSMRTGDGAQLIVPLGPDCDASTLNTQSEYVKVRQAIISAVNNPNAGYFDFKSNTPLSECLFNIGQYYSAAGTGSEYKSRFTTTWMKLFPDNAQNFAETSPGRVNASWAAAGKNQRSFCFKCQQSSTIIITDGKPTSDDNLPKPSGTSSTGAFLNDFRNWNRPDFVTNCANCSSEYLHKVAAFLNSADLRTESAMSGSQSVRTYAVSFGLGSLADATTPTANLDAIRLLNKTAELGGSTHAYITNSDTELKEALDTVVADVQKRITSFSSTNATSLQTSKSTSADAYMGRFKPQNATTWEGHLYAAQIFDEFGEGCSEAYTTANQKTFACGLYADKNPNIDGDELANGNARCSSSYLIDKDCDPIIEDETGFKKGDFNDTTHVLASNGSKANMHWDAGAALSDPTDAEVVANKSYRSAEWTDANTDKRWIWTVIDKNGDGKLTAADGLVEFRPENAAALAPMMNLPALAQTSATALPATAGVTPWCNTWLNRIGICGASPLASCGGTEAAVQTKCAEQIILFYRGWDVDDQDKDMCAGPGNYYNTNPWGACTTDANCQKNGQQNATCVTVGASKQCKNTTGFCTGGEQRDRSNDSRVKPEDREMWKLGDIFHSSPVLVRPPLAKSFCVTGAFNQCVMTLFSALGSDKSAVTPLEVSGTKDAYDLWRDSKIDRDQFVVVGANDGMFHAFNAGTAITAKAPDPGQGYPFTSGNGAEMWAFIPPDMLPNLRYGIDKHTTFVDGNPMVRDVWVDGSGGNPHDGKKQQGEFHSIAIITSRAGGQRFTAIDITDPVKPSFLWTYPQPCSEDSKLFGQNWSDFLPRPPPIGPVRLALSTGSGRDPLGRGYEERWIAFLNGGYDPALVRGRLVVMVDVWTGAPIWRFTDADLKAVRGDAKASMFPVAAGVAMMDIGGASDRTLKAPATDGYFDTATWGDLGGNLYTARFFEKGILDSNGLVTNWTAARSFEQNRKSDDTQQAAGRGQFFYMTANVLDGPSRLITLAGSADRQNLLQKSPNCSAANVLGCATSCNATAAGTATVTNSYGAASCQQAGTFSSLNGVMSYTAGVPSGCSAAAGFACGPATSPAPNQSSTLSWDCGAAGKLIGSSQFSFDASGVVTLDTSISNAEVATGAIGKPLPPYRMFGVWSYGEVASRQFSDAAGAKAFDKNRFTDVAFTGCADTVGGTCMLVETSPALVTTTAAGLEATCRDGKSPCAATTADTGWMYTYGKYCPMASCTPPAPWTDERSGTGVNVMRRCADFSTLRPDAGSAASTTSINPCDPNNNAPLTTSYLVDALTGVPRKGCGVEQDDPYVAYFAGRQKSSMAPPQAGSTRIVVNSQGQVSYSTLKLEANSTPEKTDLGRRNSLSDVLYWLEVPRQLHECRHGDGKNCK